MRLFEAILDANHRAIAGDATAGLHPADFAEALPVVALTCIEPRLNALFPNALALPADQFIWLRNAGNLVTDPLSSTMRSLALACAVEGGREIAIIGHTDCEISRTPAMKLLEELQALGADRQRLPADLSQFFGTFGSERTNVIKACDLARQSPLIGPKIPIHGLMIDSTTGKLEWVVNGYQTWTLPQRSGTIDFAKAADTAIGVPGAAGDFQYGEMKFPENKIGAWAAVTTAPPNTAPPVIKPPSPPPLKAGKSAGPPPIQPPKSRW